MDLSAKPAHAIIGVAESGEWSSAITFGDALWMARAMVGEAGEDAASDPELPALISTLVRRWALKGRGGTLSRYVRAFSQPVNPRWARGGDLAARHPDHATPAHLARRARITALPWDRIPEGIRRAVLKILSGRACLSGGRAIDWGGPILWTRRYNLDVSSTSARKRTVQQALERRETGARGIAGVEYVHVPGQSARGNVLYSTSESRLAPSVRVRRA